MLPDTVKILGHDYSVTSDTGQTRDYQVCGSSCMNGLWIKLDKTLPKSQYESTFLHEVIEQILSLNGIKINHEYICALEVGLYQVLKDNKIVFE